MAQPEQDPNFSNSQLYSNLVELIDNDVFRSVGSETAADFVTKIAKLYRDSSELGSGALSDAAELLSSQILCEGVGRVLEQHRPRLQLVDETYMEELHTDDVQADRHDEQNRYGSILPETSKTKNIPIVSRVRMETTATDDDALESPWEDVLATNSSFTRVEEVDKEVKELRSQAKAALENPELRQKVAWHLAGKEKRAVSRFSLVGELLGVQEMDDLDIVNAVAEMAHKIRKDTETGHVTGGSIALETNPQTEETE